MSDDPKKPIVHLLPAILTGSAALIASLTAVYVNVRSDREVEAAKPLPTAAAAPADKVVPPPPRPPEQFRLHLDRIAVRHDGAMMGTADWRFTVEADGDPLLSFGQDGLDDAGGRNVAQPKDVASTLRIKPGVGSAITVKAWRDRRLRFSEGPPDAEGAGTLAADGTIAPLQVVAKESDKGAFTLYFSATPLAN